MNTRSVIILLHFEDGKIIDVIREKKKGEDQETIVAGLKAEFGCTTVKRVETTKRH